MKRPSFTISISVLVLFIFICFLVLLQFSFGQIAAFVFYFFLGPRVALPSPSLLGRGFVLPSRAWGWPSFSVIARHRPQRECKGRRERECDPNRTSGKGGVG